MHNHIVHADGPSVGCPACASIDPARMTDAYAIVELAKWHTELALRA